MRDASGATGALARPSRAQLGHCSQATFEDLFHVTPAVENGNDLQRSGIGPIYDQVRVSPSA